MRYLNTIFLVSFFALSGFFSFGINQTFSDSEITQIGVESSATTVEKLQNVLKGIGLYTGEINGNYNDIKDILIDYQIENGIIESRDSYGAGYYGKKTISSFEKNFGDTFKELRKEYLTVKTPEDGEEKTFVVTAYYSPLPGQKKYSTGSYESEIKLNGGGNTASGKTPTPGTLAAPKNYAFGTKIYFEGYGVGVVEDRGGAIVNGDDYDRIDIWMGYGDEGRERTYNWGKRTIKGKIVSSDSEVKIVFAGLGDSQNSNVSEKIEEEIKTSEKIEEKVLEKTILDEYKNFSFNPENYTNENVKTLQELLTKVKLYTGEINGDFETVKNIFLNFQIQNKIVENKDSYGALYFGPKTYTKFVEVFGANLENVDNYKVENILENNDKIENTSSENTEKNDEKTENKNELTSEQKDKIKEIKNNFISNLEEKYSGDNDSFQEHLEKTKVLLDKHIPNFTEQKKKMIFSYFAELIKES